MVDLVDPAVDSDDVSFIGRGVAGAVPVVKRMAIGFLVFLAMAPVHLLLDLPPYFICRLFGDRLGEAACRLCRFELRVRVGLRSVVAERLGVA